MAFKPEHRFAGHAAAARNPKTPAHLREHQARLAREGTKVAKSMSKVKNVPCGVRVPKGQILDGFENPSYKEPEDAEPFTDNEDGETLPKAPGVVTEEPAPAGTRPKTISASLPRQGNSGKSIGGVKTFDQRGPGIQKQVGGKNLKWQRKGGRPSYPNSAFYGL